MISGLRGYMETVKNNIWKGIYLSSLHIVAATKIFNSTERKKVLILKLKTSNVFFKVFLTLRYKILIATIALSNNKHMSLTLKQ